MPNWCENEITIKNPKVFKEKCMPDGRFVFENFIEKPEHMRLYEHLMMSDSDERRMAENGITHEGLTSADMLSNHYFRSRTIDFLLSQEYMEAEEKRTGIKKGGWFDWNCENFGTKWDLDGNDADPEELDKAIEEDDEFSFYFETAWSPPMPALEAMAKMGVEFLWSCAESGCGIYMSGWAKDGVFQFQEDEPPYDDEEDDEE